MNKPFVKIAMALALVACTACSKQKDADFNLAVPMPAQIELSQDAPYVLSASSVITYPEGNELLQRNAEFLADYIEQTVGFKPAVEAAADQKGAITLTLNEAIENPEGYEITVNADGITIAGQTANGVFYGAQTLRKSLPAEAADKVAVPAAEIKDAPRFGYRGMHLDVARHFFPVEFVKKYIDILALHNMNTLHWHHTDDQGWRVEIKRYPELAELGSVRHSTVKGHIGSGEYDNEDYGGYYTQDEIKDVVKYAQDRYITIVPEIDLPGHMLGALKAYPELGCTGGPYEVSPDWGVFPDVLCLGNEKTFEFIEGVLTEIMELFPSKFVHIGGDEVPRDRWEVCAKCQARIRQLGLKADHEHSAEDRLQTWGTARIEKFLNENGRSIIGWDEILEGDVAPNATIMSWRGTQGGIKAAQMGHDVIMTPNKYLYFDYYQCADTDNEPLAIGGYLPIDSVYSFEPTAGLTDEQAAHILGVQANLWSEYIPTGEQVEYMILPRAAALAEIQWMQPEKKNFDEFTNRVVNMMQHYEKYGYNYAKHLYDIKKDIIEDKENRTLAIELTTLDNADIYYTLDGTEPTSASAKYEGPVVIDQPVKFRATTVRPGEANNEVTADIYFSKATLTDAKYLGNEPHNSYKAHGAASLVDGRRGNKNYSSGEWLGWSGENCSALIDLGKPAEISKVGVGTMTYLDVWIMGPAAIRVYVSDNGTDFTEVAGEVMPEETDPNHFAIENHEYTFEPVTAQYVRVDVDCAAGLPEGHPGAGKAPWLFIDEVTVD